MWRESRDWGIFHSLTKIKQKWCQWKRKKRRGEKEEEEKGGRRRRKGNGGRREQEKEDRRKMRGEVLFAEHKEIPTLQKSNCEVSDSVIICCQSYKTNITSHLKYKGHGGLGVRWSNLIQRVLSVIPG